MAGSLDTAFGFQDGRPTGPWLQRPQFHLKCSSDCYWAEVSSLLGSGCVLNRDFHSFAGQHRIWKPFLTQFFDALKKLIVVFGIVMR